MGVSPPAIPPFNVVNRTRVRFYVAVAAGLLTFVVWLILGDPDNAVTRTVTVLVISCPHALGLAIPLVIALSTAIAARNGILIKDRLALERMREVTPVLFDKTEDWHADPGRARGIRDHPGGGGSGRRTAGR